MLACGVAVLFITTLFGVRGYDATWRFWNIPTMTLKMGDLRVVTGGAESVRQGFNPMIENPGDPWRRPLNYPRAWQLLYLLGVTERQTVPLGFGLIVLFLTGVCLVLPSANITMLALVTGMLLSPAILLGVERANIDLGLFFIVSVAVAAVARWPKFAALTVFLGFVLKLYPVFACAALLRASRSAFLKLFLTMLAGVIVYVALTYSDLVMIRESTLKGAALSYGMNVVWLGFNNDSSYLKAISCLCVFLAILAGYLALSRSGNREEAREQTIYLDAFRAGAGIYLGSFCLGSNWDYRLMFLILVIPQLVVWTRGSVRPVAITSVVVLASIFLALWYLGFRGLVESSGYMAQAVCFSLDQVYKWMVFGGLMYLFCWSLPDWIKSSAQDLNSRFRHLTVRK
jgi:hypothetical protein